MKIINYQLGQIGTNAYLLLPENSDTAVLVDCPQGAAVAISAALKKYGRKLSAILLTHGHWDHIWDVRELSAATGAKVCASKFGSPLIEDADFQREVMFADDGLTSAKIDVKISDGDVLDFPPLKFKCMEVFGHSPDSIAYYVDDGTRRCVFTGDALFAGSIGRTDLWEGSYAALEKSIKTKLYKLPDDTVVFTGHGPSTSIGFEKKNNPYVVA